VYTAIMVPATDFLTGVLSALVIYFVTYRFLDKPAEASKKVEKAAAPLSIEQSRIVSIPGCFHSVTVPLAMTEDDKGLLHYAAHLAKLGIGKEFHFVHVVTPNEKKRNAASGEDLKRSMAEEVQSYFNGEFKHVKVDFQTMEGPSRMDELVHLTLAAKSDLILLGHRKNRSGQRSLARRLAMITNCSVWVVPQESDAEITRIIAPIDFSEPSADSLSQATALARANNIAECMALHVFFDESVIRYDEHEDIVRGEEEAAFAKFMTGIDTHGVTTKLAFEESINVANAILRRAGEYNADLIVIGTRGHSRAATILLGSVTSQVMAESKIPVLAIKHVDDRMTLMKALLSSRFIGHPDPKSN
jgi:SulP family sulfate permease